MNLRDYDAFSIKSECSTYYKLPSHRVMQCVLSHAPTISPLLTRSVWIVLLLVSINLLPSAVEGADLVNVPIDYEVYAFIDRMVAKGVLPLGFSSSRPLTRGQIADQLLFMSRKLEAGELSLSRIEQAHLKAYSKIFAQEFRKRGINVTPQQERKYFFTLQDERYTLNIQPGLQQRTVIQQSDERDVTEIIFMRPTIFGEIEEKFVYNTDYKWGPLISGERYVPLPDETRYSIGDFKQIKTLEAYTKIGWHGLSLELGKDDLWWGPGRHGALMLSDNTDSKDLLKFDGIIGPFKVTAFTAALRSELGKKYLSGHRLEMNFLDWLTLALHETVIYADRFDLGYQNPFTIYLIAIPMTEYGLKGGYGYSGDNTLIGGDFNIRIAPKIELYSEFMLDDYYTERSLLQNFRGWDTKFGILSGVYYIDPFNFKNTDLRIEYAFVNQYAYTHENPVNAYTNRGRAIGHHIGPDADDFWIELKHWFSDKIQTSFAYELLRHGEGNVDKSHQPTDSEEWEFLSGITESTHSLSLRFAYLSIGNYSFSANYNYSWIKNSEHQISVDDSKQQLVVEAEYIF